MNLEPMQKAAVLIEALPYIQRFNRKIVVVKYGGSAMVDEELKKKVIQDVVLLKLVGFKPIIVHGGGKEISRWVGKVGMEAQFKNGLRVTDEPTMEIAEMVLNKVNKSLVATLNKLGSKSIGLCGIDGGLMTARAAEGCTGELVRVDSTILETFLAQDYTPVVAAVAQGADGGETVYSVSANLTAARLAVALKAEKLIHLVESTKLLRDPAAPEAPIPELGLSQVPAMIRSGVIPPEMALKANCSVEAVRSGVRSATLLDGSVPHAILLELLSDEGIGTMLTH